MNAPALPATERRQDSGLKPLSHWIGNCNEVVETLCPSTADAMAAALDREPVQGAGAAEVPPLWHWAYFKTCTRPGDTGLDGHPKKGGFLPPVSLPRRMWAGSRIQWNTANPLRIGSEAQRRSRVQAIAPKTGRTGKMVFVTVVHEIFNREGLCLSEEQDIVFREPATVLAAGALPAAPVAMRESTWRRTLVPDEVLLFRYSALTFNSHRIHYDRAYATAVEGYPGLVVHGPLIATLLADLVRRSMPCAVMRGFRFRAVAPAMDGQALLLKARDAGDGSDVDLWAEDANGRLLMEATAEVNKPGGRQ
jgi:3-methylfumaryl-CoA hydratase